MINLGEFEQLVMFAILRLKEASGIAIHDEIEARTGRDVSPGAIYTTLARLEVRELVSSVELPPDPGQVGRPRKHYTLTPLGGRTLGHSFGRLKAMSSGLLGKLSDIAKGER